MVEKEKMTQLSEQTQNAPCGGGKTARINLQTTLFENESAHFRFKSAHFHLKIARFLGADARFE
jgi:hypothetical protein